MYNFIMTVSILLLAAYGLYHHHPVDNHIAWTAPASQDEFIRRPGKINYE